MSVPDFEANKMAVYDLDISDAVWQRAPDSPPDEAVEIAFLEGGAVAMRNSADPDGPVLRFTPGEWEAFVLGAKDGEFDID